MRRIMAVLGFGLIISCIILLNLSINFSIVLFISCISAVLLCLILRKIYFNQHLIMVLITVSIASILCINVNYNTLSPAAQLDGEKAQVVARLVDNPEITKNYVRYTFETIKINNNDENLKFHSYFSEPIKIEPYDQISGEFSFKLNENSKQFNWADGIMLIGSCYEYKTEICDDKPLHSLISQYRQAIKNSVFEHTDYKTAGIINSLVLNDDTDIDLELKDNFRELGLSHAMSVSGMHVSVVSMAILYMLTILKVSYYKRNILCILFVIAYLFAVGFVYSAVRSGVMIIIILISKTIHYLSDSINSLGLSCAIIVILNPYAAINTGFLLSVCATFGMIILYMPIMRFVLGFFKPFSKVRTIANAILTPILQSICAVIFTLPVVFATFGTLSVVSPIANFMCAGLFEVIICSGLLLIALSWIPYISDLIGLALKHLCLALEKIVDFMADIFDGLIDVNSVEIGLWIAGCLIMFAICNVLFFKFELNHRRMYLITALLCAISIIPISLTSYYFNKDVTTITIADCQNGVSAIIDDKNSTVLCGLPETAEYYVSNYFQCHSLEDNSVAIFPTLDNNYYKNTAYLLRKLNFDTVYAVNNNDKFYELTNPEHVSNGVYEISDNITAEFKTGAVKISVGTTEILFLSESSNISGFTKEYNSCDIAIVSNRLPKEIEKINARFGIISAKYTDGMQILSDFAKSSDEIYFTAGKGNIQIKTRGKKDINLKRIN